MKTYTVIRFTDAVHGHEDKTFSSFGKALLYIEANLGEITEIAKFTDGKYWESKWYHKDYFTSVKWSKILLNKKNLESNHYMKKHSLYAYGIKVTEVF